MIYASVSRITRIHRFKASNWLKFFVLALLLTTSLAQSNPKVAVSPVKVQHPGHVDVHGTGFTPKGNVSSHLRRPDGTEFPVLPMLTNDRGELTHDIDTLLLTGNSPKFGLSMTRSKVASNVARFEVILSSLRQQPRIARITRMARKSMALDARHPCNPCNPRLIHAKSLSSSARSAAVSFHEAAALFART